MPVLVVSSQQNNVFLANQCRVLSGQINTLTMIVTLLTLSIIGLAGYGLFGTAITAMQLLIWIISASMTLLALVCSFERYHRARALDRYMLLMEVGNG